MLFLDQESVSRRSGIVLKLWLSVTLFWKLFECDFILEVAFTFRSQGIQNWTFLPRDWERLYFEVEKSDYCWSQI